MQSPNSFTPTTASPRKREVALSSSKLLTIPQVLELLGVCRASFYEIVKRGELPVVKLGASSRVRASDLQQYVDGLPQLHAEESQ